MAGIVNVFILIFLKTFIRTKYVASNLIKSKLYLTKLILKLKTINGFTSLYREPSDSKVTRGDSQGHNHLVSCGAGPGQGSRPGGGSRVVGPVTPGGVGPSSCSSLQGPSLMSTTGHLQAPTSTTPEGGGVGGSSGSGMHPNFLSMETHPSPLGHSDIHIKQEISAGKWHFNLLP